MLGALPSSAVISLHCDLVSLEMHSKPEIELT